MPLARPSLVVLAALAFASACGAVASSTSDTKPVPKPAVSPDAARARVVVNRRVGKVDFQRVALSDVFDFLRDSTGVNLYVNWPALEAAGVDPSAPVSLKLSGVKVSVMLNLTLKQVGNDQLDWYIADNVLYVTTKELADRQQVTVVYPIQDLIVDVPDFKAPDFNLDSGNGGGRGGGGGSGPISGNGGGQSDPPRLSKDERAQQIITLIQNVIEPDVWDVNGGFAKIGYFNGNLIITAPRKVHERIGGSVE
jgi:hypothetical protein